MMSEEFVKSRIIYEKTVSSSRS